MSTPDLVPEETRGDVLAEVERLIEALSSHPDPDVGANARALLAGIDAVHREALTHLMGAIQSMAGEAFVNRLTGDPAIRLLLMSYDLLAVDRRTLAEEALDSVRGHLHGHGIDVELVDVLGGVVSIRLHGAPSRDDERHQAVVRDVAAALAHGLIGFQELEVAYEGVKRAAPETSSFLPREGLQRARRPTYQHVCVAADVPPGTVRGFVMGDLTVLIANVDGEFHAVRNACGDGPLPLDFSTLTGIELRCSWHGCLYDVRTGRRLDRPDAQPEEHLRVLPVRLHEGAIEVVTGTAPARDVPSAP